MTTQTLNFDDLAGGMVPEGYGGLNWSRPQFTESFRVLDTSQYPYYSNLVTSYPNFAYAWNKDSYTPGFAVPDGQSFDLASVDMAYLWGGPGADIYGYNDGLLKYSKHVELSSVPSEVDFNWQGLDRVTFKGNGYIAIDDIVLGSGSGTSANTAPVADDDHPVAFNAGESVAPLSAAQLATDAQGDTLSVTSVDVPYASVNSNGDIAINTNYFSDRLPGSADYTGTLNFTVSDGKLTDDGTLDVTVKSPVVGSTGSIISPAPASFAAESSDLHNQVVGITGAEVDVDGSGTIKAPVSLKSVSDASTVVGDVKSVAEVDSLQGITSSHFATAADLTVATTVQSNVAGSAQSTDGIAIANTVIGSQQGIELADSGSIDAFSSGGDSNVSSISSLKASSNAETVGDGTGHSGSLAIDGAWANTIAEEHLGIGTGHLAGVLTLDSAADATLNSSMSSNLSASATAKDGAAMSNAALNSSTGMDNLDVEVGGLGLIQAMNQTNISSNASSTSNGASAIGINAASSGILDSDFSFSVTDSTITAKDFSISNVNAATTNGNAWSNLQSSSMGIADLGGSENLITGAGSISAIASDQGFAHSATVSGSSTAIASQEAMGMGGYEVHNHSDLTLSAQAFVTSEANSSAVVG
jgi:hypothetical protein